MKIFFGDCPWGFTRSTVGIFMTKVVFLRKNGVFYGFRETGHTGFGEEGDDILCSALSAMTMLILNTIEVAYDIRVDFKIDDESADIIVKCKAALPDGGAGEREQYAVAGLFEGYFYQLNDLVEEYGDYLDVDVIDE